MNAATTLPGGLEVRITDEPGVTGRGGDRAWPTGRLQRGLVLIDDGVDLAQEGVGFGVPILKRGLQTIFPGGMTLTVAAEGPVWQVTAAYRLDLVERLAASDGGAVRQRLVYTAKDGLAAVHRRVPALRRPLTAASNAVRGDQGVVSVVADLSGVPAGITEIVLMNELGAGHFDRYEDSSGASLAGAAVGTWDDVGAETASFVSSRRRLAFTLASVPGTRLLRGREVVAGRLAWAGFGYVLRPGAPRFAYEVRVRRGTGDGAP